MDDTYNDGLSMSKSDFSLYVLQSIFAPLTTPVTKPDRNVPVLIYCRKDCGEILLET